MLRAHTWVSVHCDQCADTPTGAGFEPRYPDEAAALHAASAEGWLVGPDGQLWCPVCGPVLRCEAEGHDFGPWHPLTATSQVVPGGREYRNCRQCCLHESHTTPTAFGEVA